MFVDVDEDSEREEASASAAANAGVSAAQVRSPFVHARSSAPGGASLELPPASPRCPHRCAMAL
jgi:hypothetical protein